MGIDERFDDLAASLGSFYRAWAIHLGLELGLLAHLRTAGTAGLRTEELAAVAGCAAGPVSTWCRAAYAAELVSCADGRVVLDPDVASILLDEDWPEYLGGQFAYAVTSSLDWDRMADFIRTGRTVTDRPPRYHRSIEQLTRQDIAIFFEEALAALPDVVADLIQGARVVDLHCGGGRWLVAVARRFPSTRLVGVEFEPDSVARAMRAVQAAGLEDRIRIEARDVETMTQRGEFDLAYFQHALHELRRPAAALGVAWTALRPGGRLLVLGWCLPERLEDYATLHGQLIAGVALDELYSGARLRSVAEHAELFRQAGLPEPQSIALPSGATLLVARREA